MFYAPAKTPVSVVASANAAINAAPEGTSVIESLATTGLIARGSTIDEIIASQKIEFDREGQLVKKIGFSAASCLHHHTTRHDLPMTRGICTFSRQTTESPSSEAAVNTTFLESLLGYNARRAALTIIEVFLERRAVYRLRLVDFSLLSLVSHNPGITSTQLCATLGILPPNLVKLVADLDKRGLLQRKPHPTESRAIGLHLTVDGHKMVREGEATSRELEDGVAAPLTPEERETLMTLLREIYKQ